ncbi:MAG: 2-amino-4-hydroxy-6-hydroxymethyldihydropteridine diphosphokinase [Pseudomonadota bacterium]
MNCLVAIGSNLPKGGQSPADLLSHALWMFEGEGLHVVAQSAFYNSPAYPAGNGPDYVNAVVQVETQLTPEEVLESLHRIEAALGRVRTTRWEARVIDLDLIACESRVVPDTPTVTHWIELSESRQMEDVPDQLLVPHPRLQDRAFVLVPLAEVAPEWTHPLSGLTAGAMLASLDPVDTRAVVRLD